MKILQFADKQEYPLVICDGSVKLTGVKDFSSFS